MIPGIVFSVTNLVALAGWILLLGFPKWKRTLPIVRFGVVALLAATYVAMISITIPDFSPDMFSSLENVRALFQNDWVLTAGWVHYLAFDLFVGTWIVKTGLESGMKRWQYSLPLPFVFMFGPLGLLIFYGIKALKK